MKRNLLSLLLLLCIGGMTELSLFGQLAFHIGMPATEFSEKNPGILPNEMEYSKQLALPDTLQKIQGTWNFGVFKNRLVEAQFHGQNSIRTKAEFEAWEKSAASIVAEYSSVFGEAVTYLVGSNQFVDPQSRQYEGADGQREIFHEAVWVKYGMRIRLNCDFGTHHTAEKPEFLPNAPLARSTYEFSIVYERIPSKMVPKPIDGAQFWLGMQVQDFAKVFPSLFPNGTDWTGQWQHPTTENELEGVWTFDFDAGKLTHAAFVHFSEDLSSNSAIKCIQGTEELIDSLQKTYGKPNAYYSRESELRGDQGMESISMRMLEAQWDNANGMKINIECMQFGGKSEPQYTVTLQFTKA